MYRNLLATTQQLTELFNIVCTMQPFQIISPLQYLCILKLKFLGGKPCNRAVSLWEDGVVITVSLVHLLESELRAWSVCSRPSNMAECEGAHLKYPADLP